MRKSNLRATAGWQALAILGAGAFIASPAAAQETTAPPSSETQPSVDQQAAVAEPEDQADEDDAIVVTGSRIVRPDLEAPSPVTTVDSEQFDLTGTVTVETLLNELPQLIPGNTRTSNNQGGEDFSTLDLRGLGPQRTLILVDGERIPASSTTGVVDIGTIPAGLIERVDVVTGGASAVYGSDAMAGVVNFVLKDNFEGLEATAQYGISDHGDGSSFNIQGLLGGNFGDDRGNMTFFASYYTRESVGQGDRDITRDGNALGYDYNLVTGDIYYFVPDYLTPASAYTSRFGADGFIGICCGGSATPPWGVVVQNAANPFRNLSTAVLAAGNDNFTAGQTDTNCDLIAGGAVNSGNLSFNDAGELMPRSGATGLCAYADRSTGSYRFNFNPFNYLITPYTRLGLATTARYDITDSIRLKVIANYVDSEQEVNLAPTPAGGATGLVVPADSFFIPADLRAALNTRTFFTGTLSGVSEFGSLTACTNFDGPDAGTAPDGNVCTENSGAARPFNFDRRFTETGPRIGIYDSKTATIRGTLSGPLTAGFNWDATLSYGRVDATATLKNNINKTAVAQGLNNCRNSAGVVNGQGILPNCVPIDVFGPNTLTPEMIDFIRLDTKETRYFDQARIAGNITGNLIDLPAGPVGIAVGVEARTDRGKILVDDAQRTGDIIGFNATQDQSGKVNVKEIYGEARVPILADMPFFHSLEVEAGARYSDYSSVGGLFNWKLGAQWSPIEWIKIRGIYNKAARAPSITELFLNGDQGFPAAQDFCRFPGSGNNLAICQAQVVAAGGPANFDFTGFVQSNNQVQAFAFGNTGLSEETANTYTIGAVLTPNLGLGRFSATIDYYNIKLSDLIVGLGAQTRLNACAATADPNSVECSPLFIGRNPQTGQIDYVNTSVTNAGVLKTAGIDGSINFVVPFADLGIGIPGRLRFQELISWLDKWKFNGTENAGTTAGGIGGTLPEWKSTMTLAYDSDSFTAQLRWNWQSDVADVGLCPSAEARCVVQAGDLTQEEKTPGLSYFDLSLRKKIGDNFEITGIVQNIFNQKARETATGVIAEGGVDVAYWNPIILGRYFTIAARVKM
jgi:iron complex outermembrane receptor protein